MPIPLFVSAKLKFLLLIPLLQDLSPMNILEKDSESYSFLDGLPPVPLPPLPPLETQVFPLFTAAGGSELSHTLDCN